MADIKMYRLVSGEEIIVNVTGTTPEYVNVKDAVVIAYHQTNDGRMSAGFAPFMPYSQGDITLYTNAIAACTTVKDDMLSEYNRIFSNIVIAPAGILST